MIGVCLTMSAMLFSISVTRGSTDEIRSLCDTLEESSISSLFSHTPMLGKRFSIVITRGSMDEIRLLWDTRDSSSGSNRFMCSFNFKFVFLIERSKVGFTFSSGSNRGTCFSNSDIRALDCSRSTLLETPVSVVPSP